MKLKLLYLRERASSNFVSLVHSTEGHTIFMGGFEDEDAAKKWLKKSGVAFVAVRHTGKACFADLGSEEDVQKAVAASDDQHRYVAVGS